MNTTSVVTCAKMKEIEKRAAESGLSYYQMMENAGTGAAAYIMNLMDVSGKRALVFCGKGNNGGDGFVVARKLAQAGAKPQVVLADGEPVTGDAIRNRDLCITLRIPLVHIPELLSWESSGERWGQPPVDFVVDAIYGTGFHGSLSQGMRGLTRAINESAATVFALDIPSGLSGDSGEADPDTIRAAHTLVFHARKPAHETEHAGEYCGRIDLIDIGIPF